MKRHSPSEITEALNQARDMMSRGHSQSAICKALNISVMTLHRWRKDFGDSSGNSVNEKNLSGREDAEIQIADLREENQRLRRIVTDLLLEKARVEEAIAQLKTRA
jgi:putative transposase